MSEHKVGLIERVLRLVVLWVGIVGVVSILYLSSLSDRLNWLHKIILMMVAITVVLWIVTTVDWMLF